MAKKSTAKSRAAFVAKLHALCDKHDVMLSGDRDGNVLAYFKDGRDKDGRRVDAFTHVVRVQGYNDDYNY